MTAHSQRRAAPVSIEIPIAWGDMDAFQHVNNVVYLRWFESARVFYFERMGAFARKDAIGIGPILARAEIDYRHPVAYPDKVRVGASVTSIGTRSFTMGFWVWSEAQQATVATGLNVLAMYDYRAEHSVPVDEALRATIKTIEASAC